MRNVSRAALWVAGLMAMALFVAHCGDSDVRVTTGVSPSPGTFRGTTGTDEAITIEVGSIDSVTLECSGETLIQRFKPAAPVNSDGTFDVEVTDQGKKVHVSGRFGTNDTVAGTINDEDGDCDTTFNASRSTGVPTAVLTTTPTGGVTATSTLTPEPVETPTPTGEAPTEETPTPTGEAPTEETPTPAGGTPTATPNSAASPCPDKIEILGTSGAAGVLDAGWTGQSHDSQVVSDGKITVDVACQEETKPCGVCTLSGPVANVNAANYTAQTGSNINNQRCTGDTAVTCTSNSDCSTAGGTCQFYFGSYLPLSAGGVSTCVGNMVNGQITGTANIESGASDSTVPLTSRVYTGPAANDPCPKCVDDATRNDGKRDGTCSGGAHPGAACDINGSSANVYFGDTSLDCPPQALAQVADLPINLASTTGTATRTLTADSPNCSATGFTTLKCFCDTCDNAAATPCRTNADCSGGHVCGGKRCVGGGNNGTPCTANSECSPGACDVAGKSTAPNECSDATCNLVSGNDGECQAGPFEQFCGPSATFKSCLDSTECEPFNICVGGSNAGALGCTGAENCPGDGGRCEIQVCGATSATAHFRKCFLDNGALAGSVNAQGKADPPKNGESNPTLAALFCIAPTSSGAVNGVAGLPGLGRLELPAHAREIVTTP